MGQNTIHTTPRRKQDPRWAKQWRYDRDHGIRRYVDAGPVREHVHQLRAKGATYRGIAQLASVSPNSVYKVAAGQRHVQRPTAAKILAVTPELLFQRREADDFVPGVGAARRLQALAALGHNPTTIAAAMGPGATPAIVRNTRAEAGAWISRLNYDRTVAAYEALWNRPGTSNQTRSAAAKLGYAPPLAWDDDTIDDPDAEPQHDLAPESGTLSPIKRVHLEDIDELSYEGMTFAEIAARLQVSKDAIHHCLRRTDDQELASAIRRRLHRSGVAAAEIPA